jgi:metallo-beta-lactamase class B
MMPKTSTLAILCSLLAIAHGQVDPLSTFANKTTFPNEQASNVTKYLTEAASLATDPRLYQYFMDQCIVQQVYPQLFGMPSGYVKPFEAFDNFYFVGHTGVSAWAYDTGDGLLVIDALNNQDEIDAVMLPMLKELGFQGADIKSVIITHEHIDHYGGAKYLQDRFGVKVYGSAPFWEALALIPANSTVPPPTEDETLVDGQEVVLGNLTVTTVTTPGHTLGTISLIFPVYDNGKAHVAGLSGGTGTPNNQTLREMKIESQNRFADIATHSGVDVILSNHQVADHAVQNADILEHMGPGVSNPFVVGVENFANYMRINAVCSQVIAARQGMDLESTDEKDFNRRSIGPMPLENGLECHM